MREPQIEHYWSVERPKVLVVACSDGRLQEITDDFLSRQLGIVRYDRFYAPGGAGALAPTGRDFVRARQMRNECHYLIDLHGVERTILLFHGPAPGGPPDAMCADYRRKMPTSPVDQLLERQVADARELLGSAREWAGGSAIDIYRCEVSLDGSARFVHME